MKAATQVKEERLSDAAVQRFGLEGSGVRLDRVYLMHLNGACAYPDLSNLFAMEDAAERMGEALAEVPDHLEEFLKLLGPVSELEAPVGPQCSEPYRCPFYEYCWESAPVASAFDIPRLPAQAKAQLAQRNILAIEELPADFPLPRFEGLHPYGRFGFQYSCCVLEADDRLRHCEYLHAETTDPPPPGGL